VRFRAFVISGLVAVAIGVSATAPAAAAAPVLTVGGEVTSASLTNATYAIVVTNRGDATADGVELTTTVPANMTVASTDPAPSSGCAAGATSGECKWTIGALPASASRTISISYTLEDGDYRVSQSASVTGTNAGAGDSDTDQTLHRDVMAISHDAFVNDGEAANTDHGACDELQISAGNTITSFLESDNAGTTLVPSGRPVDAVWAAELRTFVKSNSHLGSSALVGLHPILGQEWGEGAGSCAPGGNGTGNQARAGHEPVSETSPVATMSVGAAGQQLRWNILPAVDSAQERMALDGFELRDAGSTTPGTVAFTSSEGAQASERPEMVAVWTERPSAQCVDIVPETPSALSDQAQTIEAYVTDGERLGDARTGPCSGSPRRDEEVTWNLDDDAPDAWFSSMDGVSRSKEFQPGGAAGANHVATSTNSLGRTSVGLRLNQPYEEGKNAGSDRVAAIIGAGARDPEQPGNVPCDVDPCPGENAVEDDAAVDWTPTTAPPPPTGGGGTETGGGGDTGAGGGETGGATPPVQSPSRSVTLSAPGNVLAGKTLSLAGRLVSSSAGCADAGEFVQILRRRRGASEFKDFASVSTLADGTFELPILADATADYVAVAPAAGDCPRAASEPAVVLVSPRVVAAVGGLTSARSRGAVAVVGYVKPRLGGTVVLEWRSGERWRRVASVKLGRRSAFSLPLTPNWSGKRTFRVRWKSPTPRYADGVSKTFGVRAKSKR
jgi:Domain of unknown function DUF11